jgi:SAM-dependent methyltransferase
MLPSDIRAQLTADPSQWLGRRLFQADQTLIFDNVLGRFTRIDPRAIGREATIDMETGASQRFRVLIYALTKGLGLHPILPENAAARLRGIGLSDDRCYARVLARLFDYTNTYYHKQPFLDICAAEPGYSDLDFIISSDVFEHLPPPPDVAFRNCHRMLKPGGVLILTVPYGDQTEHTVEHYPSLHQWTLRKRPASGGIAGGYYIENIDVRGEREVFDKVRFHGGPGQTVEMRVFSKKHLLELAAQNGFTAEIVAEDVPLFGIWNQGNMHSLPMILRKR